MQGLVPVSQLQTHSRGPLPLFTWKTIRPRNIKPENDNLLSSHGYILLVLLSIFWTDRQQSSKGPFSEREEKQSQGKKKEKKEKERKAPAHWFMHLYSEFINLARANGSSASFIAPSSTFLTRSEKCSDTGHEEAQRDGSVCTAQRNKSSGDPRRLLRGSWRGLGHATLTTRICSGEHGSYRLLH